MQMHRTTGRLSYANVVATLALFISLAGTSAFAATQLAKNSIGTKQLKKSAVTTSKIKAEAVTGSKIAFGAITWAKVAPGSIYANDLAPGTIPSQTEPLGSGQTIVGYVGIENTAAGGSEFFGGSAGFPILPPSPIDEKHRVMVTGSSTPDCPGKGKAEPGYLCVYQTQSANAKEPRLFPEGGLASESATYGFLLQIESETTGTVLYGADWAYTGPLTATPPGH